MEKKHTIIPYHSHLFAAIGSALNSKKDLFVSLRDMQNRLANRIHMDFEVERLEPLFASEKDYKLLLTDMQNTKFLLQIYLHTKETHSLELMQVPQQQKQP